MLLRRRHEGTDTPVDETTASSVPVDETTTELPGGNASRDEWETYALAHGRTAEDLDGLKRDEIRDLFKEEEA